jgi:IS30 family transposase
MPTCPSIGKVRKRGYRPVKLALNNLKGRSIEERPPEVAQRETFGHWEIDSVEGKVGTKEVLLVFSERLTRHEFIFKLPHKTQDEVKKVLDCLEAKYGNEKFRQIFKTLTCDNGCEFLNQAKLEKSIGDGNRLTVYYCHPYSAYERGTNENINRMIRRYIPKGSDIGNYTPAQIQKIQDHINSTPRLVLEGYPSNTRFQEHIA